MASYFNNKTNGEIAKISNAWSTMMNPLRNLTQTGIQQLIDNIKRGNDVKLQVAFKEIEQQMPIFGICLNKRLAGITSRKWDIIPIDESAEAKAQAETVKKMFYKSDTRNLDGLTECLRHLGMAAFRGRSVVKPFINDDNELYFKNIENWNALTYNNRLYWNPDADQSVDLRDNNTLEEISEDEVIWVSDERPIDLPGLMIYLRQLIGEDRWSMAVEKFGIPPVVITAPEGTPDQALDVWYNRAIQIWNGGSGVLPPGAKVDTLSEARGQDPFSEYVNHQMRMICILAVGNTSSILGDVGSGLGSDVATKQDDQFQQLVSYDCKRIANSITRCAVAKCVKRMFNTDEVKCRFSFVEDDYVTPKEYLDMATTLKNMGVTIDIAKLKEMTKLSFIADEQSSVWQPNPTTLED